MKPRLPRDEDLPTWAHTALLLLIVTPFACLLIWPGVRAVVSGVLPPMSGPEFGQWMFGNRELRGQHAVLAGSALCGLGLAMMLMAAAYSRWAQHHRMLRVFPWVFLAGALAFYSYVLQAVR